MTDRSTVRAMMAVSLMTAATPGLGQFRSDQPATLQAPPPAPDPSIATVARFRASYARAGSPRIVVFWNREFDDEVASAYQDKRREHEVESTDGNGLEEVTQGPSGQMTRTENKQVREKLNETTSGTERVRAAQRGHMGSEAVDWQVEQAFTTMLEQGGANLVDRRMAMRMTGSALGAGERANVQEIETRGMSGYADIIVEVLQSPDARAPGGVSYRIVAREFRSARTLATVFTAGQPPKPRMGYVAGPNGFVRAVAPEPGPSDIGAQLAVTLMGSLAAGLR